MKEQPPPHNIATALAQCRTDQFTGGARALLNAMGYASQQTIAHPNTAEDFLQTLPWQRPGTTQTAEPTESENHFRAAVKTATIIFQWTEQQIADTTPSNRRSFLFCAVDLQPKSKNGKPHPYTRAEYGEFTREINKRLIVPTVILFRAPAQVPPDTRVAAGADRDGNTDTPVAPTITIAFVGRRQNLQHTHRAVLQTVSLIKDISTATPHPAHIKMLDSLHRQKCLDHIHSKKLPLNYATLSDTWLAKLDTKLLSKSFYAELFKWFQRITDAQQPPAVFPKDDDTKNHVIRLITRILFIWFIKEKGLVAEQLFTAAQMRDLVVDLNDSETNRATDPGNYYRAILQNLFFATLNTEMTKREFSKNNRSDHRNFNRWRYPALLRNKTRFQTLMAQTPFINGGLFDCLDTEEAGKDSKIIDCFSDPNPATHAAAKKQRWAALHIPDYLFFDQDHGLFPLLNKYKFTVAENTPIEQEVALEPELLGMVFENLLAEVDTTTQEAARKQTGSYYTPRPIVDYMVDESLIAYLQKAATPVTTEALRDLLDYAVPHTGDPKKINIEQGQAIVEAICRIKILDPAVGSGAFPMGILHKLVLVLSRLDPYNIKNLGNHKGDFGRKLFLIQNSIYGVDKQPIACQIAKLRFFISLAIEQEANDDKADNYGIKPLPNLETKIVAADTLIGIKRPNLHSDKSYDLGKQIQQNRQQHFNARTREVKLKCIKTDRELRGKLSAELKRLGYSDTDAEKIARWDPYNQTATADWFDSEYMFGITDGFDIVIANPPYIQLQKNGGTLADRYQNQGFKTFARTGDIYCLFYEKGLQITTAGGVMCYITSNKWIRAPYGKNLRRFLSANNPIKLLDLGPDIFTATVDTNILLAEKTHNQNQLNAVTLAADFRLGNSITEYFNQNHSPLNNPSENTWTIGNTAAIALKEKIEQIGTPLKQWNVKIYRGITTGYDEAFIINQKKHDELVAADKNNAKILKPVLRGRDIKRYQHIWDKLWLIDTHNGYNKNMPDEVPAVDINDYPAVKDHLDAHIPALTKRMDKGNTLYNLRDCAYYPCFFTAKIVYPETTQAANFFFDKGADFYIKKTAFMLTGKHLLYLTGILSSKLVTYYFVNFSAGLKLGKKGWSYGKHAMETLPIPTVEAERRPLAQKIATLAEQITTAKKQNPQADTTATETKIDHLVYQLYQLTPAEIKTIESTP